MPRPTAFDTVPPRRPFRGAGRIALLAAALALAGCGGSVSLGFGFGDDEFDDNAPAVSLAAGANSAQAGATLQLVAAASDRNGIDSVAFYRIDDGGAMLLGADGTSPFQWNAAVPGSASGSVSFFARATDGVGRQADSEVVTIAVVP